MINEQLFETTLKRVREIIAEETGNEFDEILPDMHLEDELEILNADLKRIIRSLNTEYRISINATEIDAEESVETVRQLTTVVCEEIELG